MKKSIAGMCCVLMVMAVSLLAGCGSGGGDDLATVPDTPVGSTALISADLTTPATVYAVTGSGYIAYKFSADGSVLASAVATSGSPALTIVGAWSIATDNKTVGLILPGQSSNPLYTLTAKDPSGQFWDLTGLNGTAVRFYFDLNAAQAYYASLIGQSGTKTRFTTADFSGKTIYYVNGSAFQKAVFNADGTVQASGLLTSGTPTTMTLIGTWSISSTGALQLLNNSNQTVTYTLASHDAANSYYRTIKTFSGSSGSSTTGLFYNQTTGLSQAQTFTLNGQQP